MWIKGLQIAQQGINQMRLKCFDLPQLWYTHPLPSPIATFSISFQPLWSISGA